MASIGEDMEKWGCWYTVNGNAKWCSHYGKPYRYSSKNEKQDYCMIQGFNVYPKELISGKKNTCISNFIAVLLMIAKGQK